LVILSADIGGTKTLLQLCDIGNHQLNIIYQQRLISGEYKSFDQALDVFLQGQPKPQIACLAVAGPVATEDEKQSVQVTNLPWQINNLELAAQFDIPVVKIINDFKAIGYGIEVLNKDDILVLQEGQAQAGTRRAIIGAGTGLGEALLVYQQNRYEVYGMEGGHADYAPVLDIEFKLASYLRKEHPRISCEKVLSGQGIVNIYHFLEQQHPELVDPELNSKLTTSNPVAISRAAQKDNQSLAAQAMTLFTTIYGSQAGNLALTTLPYDGLYIGGGIAAKNVSFMQSPAFLTAFSNKSPMQKLLKKIPVKLILNQQAGLLGARQLAYRLSKK